MAAVILPEVVAAVVLPAEAAIRAAEGSTHDRRLRVSRG